MLTRTVASDPLAIARDLIAAGIPVFLARPAGGRTWDPTSGTGGSGYWLPRGWQQTEPDPAVIGRWGPGMALAAVMGHVFDGIDVDPRHGGTESLRDLPVPRVYGVQGTPSGGWHGLTALLGTGSRDAVRPGIDIKGGRPDGTGRGFLWVAPTVRLSKVTGELAGYRWQRPPDLTGIDGDTSGARLAEIIRGLRGETSQAVGRVAQAPTSDPGRLLDGLVATVRDSPEGTRNRALHWAACRAAEHDLTGGLSWQEAAVHLSAAGEQVGLPRHEVASTLASAYRTARGGAA